MRFTESRHGDVVVMALSGRFMAGADCDRLRERIRSLAGTGPAWVLLDLTEASFIDSAAIGLLISAHVTLARGGGALRICCPSDRVCQVLCVCHLERVIESYPSRDAGLAAFPSRSPQTGKQRPAAEESA
jgi:anti-anti-sigma factor